MIHTHTHNRIMLHIYGDIPDEVLLAQHVLDQALAGLHLRVVQRLPVSGQIEEGREEERGVRR